MKQQRRLRLGSLKCSGSENTKSAKQQIHQLRNHRDGGADRYHPGRPGASAETDLSRRNTSFGATVLESHLTSTLSMVAATTFYITVAILLSGLVSGIVAVGIFQLFARESIHRRSLRKFFVRLDIDEFVRWRQKREADTAKTPSKHADLEYIRVQRLIHEPVLCRLYYRQLAGHFLSIASSEAALNRESGAPTPLLDVFEYLADSTTEKFPSKAEQPQFTARQGDGKLQNAVEQIDRLQAMLGDAVSRASMAGMTLFWFISYTSIGLMTDSRLSEGFRDSAESWVLATTVLRDVIVSLVLTALVAAVLAVASAAAGLVSFSALDRMLSTK